MASSRLTLSALALGVSLALAAPMAAFAQAAANAAPAAPKTYYVEPGTYGTQRETDPPAYVKNVGTTNKNSLTWLDAGIEYRMRYEYRDDDLRRPDPTGNDDYFLHRTRVFAAVKNVLDPLRFTVELTDSRLFGSIYPRDVRDVDHMEFIQGYAELYFNSLFAKDPRGNARPLRIRAGRHAFEVLDRRLVARNEWRNTTNSFEGVRVNLGDDNNDWALEGWSLKPITRLEHEVDKPNLDINFNAVLGHLRFLSPGITVEPYYFQLDQDGSAANAFRERNILSPGVRAYGRIGSAINYDVSVTKQHGRDGTQNVDAEALTAEIGYSWSSLKWRPRLSASYGYASGDDASTAGTSERFERFYGFGRPWSADDYFIYENLHAPKLRVEFQPYTGIRVDAGYNWYRLASSTDRFNNLLGGAAGNRDRLGRSGSDAGSNWDFRVRFPVMKHVQGTIGYSSYDAGNFSQNRQRATTGNSADGSDFFYVEMVWRWFE
jgi:hypothetical protein